ncbi:imidazole glycerol phosphate synthase subunit HisH [Thalassospira sp. GO-4]|jgi:glutamine amidotransferase|uniref:imidazole glycerol phosphate synthase subunit HisH n=1 Tax=Thalassospira sp. GO-4 TaxID=2946605 RepID=UPI002024E40D|nr:imidazole glycerol phosphate synthase subunit HisH [Thalassospira sp. GO-4]URK17328.1 imidazole glycerol phosphate synthase subunit HisH [Thalassospira sp. GO-4]
MTSATVAIIDYGMGNLFSVARVCEKVGLHPRICNHPDAIAQCDSVILPGIGGFVDAMKALGERELDVAISEFSRTGKPLMGICLGMQLLCSTSTEFKKSNGLDLISGTVTKLPNQHGRKVPEVGWNDVSVPNGKDVSVWNNTPLHSFKDGDLQYFVHSYYVTPDNREHILTTTTYGDHTFCSSVRRENIYGFQFHPERSAEQGLSIYQGFANIVKKTSLMNCSLLPER